MPDPRRVRVEVLVRLELASSLPEAEAGRRAEGALREQLRAGLSIPGAASVRLLGAEHSARNGEGHHG